MIGGLYPGDTLRLGEIFAARGSADDGAEIRDKYGLTREPALVDGVPNGVRFFLSLPSLGITGDELLAALDPVEYERVTEARAKRERACAKHEGPPRGVVLLPDLDEQGKREADVLARCGLTIAGAARLIEQARNASGNI